MMIPCPKCGGELYYRPGKWGSFYSCKDYPVCRGKMSTRDVWLAERKTVSAIKKHNREIKKAAQTIANMRMNNG